MDPYPYPRDPGDVHFQEDGADIFSPISLTSTNKNPILYTQTHPHKRKMTLKHKDMKSDQL